MTKYFEEINDGNMDLDFLSKLDEAREMANIPFKINSAYRSKEHNANIGGKPNSSHLKGLAVDISVTDSRSRFIVLEALIKVGFNRIGIADTFIHVDDDKDKSDRVVWTY
jgi:zinc D-Ala-D-Ala carboxypeptidase